MKFNHLFYRNVDFYIGLIILTWTFYDFRQDNSRGELVFDIIFFIGSLILIASTLFKRN